MGPMYLGRTSCRGECVTETPLLGPYEVENKIKRQLGQNSLSELPAWFIISSCIPHFTELLSPMRTMSSKHEAVEIFHMQSVVTLRSGQTVVASDISKHQLQQHLTLYHLLKFKFTSINDHRYVTNLNSNATKSMCLNIVFAREPEVFVTCWTS